ncbi:DEKNAAC103245 [Brettanomyces naardenensis]|uniref:DEKNAAC103245 n=1 Tax=Brettanomyces naardenensis TaxID=13370 RepID=A0A448YMW5_BRENA|nr:DEKNAAC103245 [Brettanomyces naardenensis]
MNAELPDVVEEANSDLPDGSAALVNIPLSGSSSGSLSTLSSFGEGTGKNPVPGASPGQPGSSRQTVDSTVVPGPASMARQSSSVVSSTSVAGAPSSFAYPVDESQILDGKARQFLVNKLVEQKGIIFTEYNDIQLKLFDVDSTLSPLEFDKLAAKLDPQSKILLCEKVKLIYGFNSLAPFIVRLINILNFSTFFSIFDITSNIKLYGFYSLNYTNPVEILVKQIRHDLFIVKSFKEFTIQEMKREHDFHLPYKEFKRLNLNDGNLVVVKILFKNEQKPIDLSLIKPLLPRIKLLHLSLESEAKLKPFNDMIDQYGTHLKYLKFGVNRGTFKKIPIRNSIEVMKLVNIDNLNFINDLKECQSLDVFFDNWELRRNCDIKFQQNFIIKFNVMQRIQNLRTLNIFHTYLDSKDLNKLKMFPNLTYSKISYVILDNDGFDMSECKKLQELKIHFTYHKQVEEADKGEDPASNIQWPPNVKKLSVTIHNIKNLVQNFSIRLNILKKIAKPLPPSVVDLCIDISYDTGGSGPELYSISRDDILKISLLINQILTNNLENLKLKGISRYNYKIGKPLIFSAINFPASLKLLSLNDFILDYNFINLPKLKKLYFEHSLFDSDFRLPDSDEILIEKCTFKDLAHLPDKSTKIEFKMCTFRKIPSYNGDVSNVVINNCRVMEQPTNNIFQFQQQLQMRRDDSSEGQQGQSPAQGQLHGGQRHSARQNGSQNGQNDKNNQNGLPSKSFPSAPALSASSSMDGTIGSQPRHRQQGARQSPELHRHIRQKTAPPSQQPSMFVPNFVQQSRQSEFAMFPSSSLGPLSNSSNGQVNNSGIPDSVPPMKPSASMGQIMSQNQQGGVGFNDYDYLNGGSQFSNFIDRDLELRLNGLSLSNSSPYMTYPPVIGGNTQGRHINSPPLMSLSMSPSASSQQQNQQQNQQGGSDSHPNSRSANRFSGLMSQFSQPAMSQMQPASGYGMSSPSFDGSFMSSASKANFGYFMNENNLQGYMPPFQQQQQQQQPLRPGTFSKQQGQQVGRSSGIVPKDGSFNELLEMPRANTSGVTDSF